MLTPIRSVPALSVIELTDVIISQGLVSRRELENLNLSFHQLDANRLNYSSLANERVPEYELVTIWNHVVNTLKRPDIGLFISMNIKAEYRGPLAKLILHSESVSHALKVFTTLQKWANPADNWSIGDSESNSQTFTLRYQIDRKVDYPHAFIERNMSMLVAWMRTMTGQTIVPLKACFSFPAPKHHKQYLPIFGHHCQFNSCENTLAFASDTLNHKNVNSDPYLFKLLWANLHELMNNHYSKFQITSRVKQEILSTLPSIMTIEEVSEKLNLSRSSLYRKLKKNGTTYSALLKEVRMQLAQSQLKDGSTINQVAYSLGFSDTSSFQKWCKSCFSEPPSILKEKLAGIPTD
ncbi:AraC family transcriptional regulator ligand-binding domain-containing protein [Marinicella sp. W31]|uniref:AraC family transcriptional regulator n=1 Tax=Marinicella sp. W31 TaxID=3023713 RepID=UPI0037574679